MSRRKTSHGEKHEGRQAVIQLGSEKHTRADRQTDRQPGRRSYSQAGSQKCSQTDLQDAIQTGRQTCS